MNLTPKQLRVLTMIQEYRQKCGYSPTMRELAEALEISKVTVFEHVEALIKKGALIREPNKARSLSIPENARIPGSQSEHSSQSDHLSYPLAGRIAAGYPLEKFEQNDELDLATMFGSNVAQSKDTFALQVEGESMRDEGILDGDYVLVAQRSTARNGERVIALLPDGESTLKTFHKQPNGQIMLRPANPEFEDIIVDQCTIQGVVIGVLRRY